MNPHFEIKDKEVIYDILDNAEYGTLALCVDDKPYAVPVNFVRIDDALFFHGALEPKICISRHIICIDHRRHGRLK